MTRYFVALALIASTVMTAQSALASCRNEVVAEARYVICEFSARHDRLELLLKSADGQVLGEFDSAKAELAKRGSELVFAMNAGMYHADRAPVGLYIENGKAQTSISTRAGFGNFHLLPNGVFYITDQGAGVLETKAYIAKNIAPKFATQSGPMLLIDNALHPRFLPDSTWTNRRNGVGVDGDRVVFALSDTPVTFDTFARLFRDTLKTPNALYLDGSISRVFSADIARNDGGAQMGPIVAVTRAVAAKP